MGPGGWTKYLDKRISKEKKKKLVIQCIAGNGSVCSGKCNKTRYQCLKQRQVNIGEDRKMMRSLQYRYDSWLQGREEFAQGNSNYFHHNLFNQD